MCVCVCVVWTRLFVCVVVCVYVCERAAVYLRQHPHMSEITPGVTAHFLPCFETQSLGWHCIHQGRLPFELLALGAYPVSSPLII